MGLFRKNNDCKVIIYIVIEIIYRKKILIKGSPQFPWNYSRFIVKVDRLTTDVRNRWTSSARTLQRMNFKKASTTGHFGLVVEENSVREIVYEWMNET